MSRDKAKTVRSPYGFDETLRAEFPSQVIVDATELCNLECIHCPHPSFKRSEHYTGARIDPALNEKMALEVASHGAGITQFIRYTANGEPLLHREIFRLLEDAVRISQTKVCLTTNGTLLTPERSERLLSIGLFMIDVSIDASTPATYAKVRRKGDLAEVEKNTLELLRIRKMMSSSTRIVTSFVEQDANASERAEFEAAWKERGADACAVRPKHTHSNFLPSGAGFTPARRPCVYPWERITLSPSGHLAYCPTDWTHASVLADYRETTIRETWSGDAYRKLRDAHLSSSFEAHALCGQCPDWAMTRWRKTGFAYRDLVANLSPAEPL